MRGGVTNALYNKHLNTQLAISTDLFAFYPWNKQPPEQQQQMKEEKIFNNYFRESLHLWKIVERMQPTPRVSSYSMSI